LQHHAAQRAPSEVRGSLGLIRHLLRQPVWLLGQLLSVTGLVLHAQALHLGSIAVVQPIAISGVVLAVPVRSALSRRWPWPREVLAVTLTATGLAVFLVTSRPSPGTEAPLETPALVICAVALLLAVLAAALSRRLQNPTGRSFLLGCASGVLFGAVAGLLKAVLHDLTASGLPVVLTAWTTWALVVLGGAAMVNNQQSYRLARLSASMPVLNVVDGVVALTFGLLAFQEVPRHAPMFLVLEVLAFVAISAGLFLVARLEEPSAAELLDPTEKGPGPTGGVRGI
jgi:drug/metabolite transporter (DMT)-like permease